MNTIITFYHKKHTHTVTVPYKDVHVYSDSLLITRGRHHEDYKTRFLRINRSDLVFAIPQANEDKYINVRKSLQSLTDALFPDFDSGSNNHFVP